MDVLSRTSARALFLPDAFLGRDYLQGLRSFGSDGEDEAALVPGLPHLALAVTVASGEPAGDRPRGAIAFDQLAEMGLGVDESEVERRALAVAPDDVADILFTSGTTGRSKGALSAHRQTVGASRAWVERANVQRGDSFLIISPFFHSFGYKAGIVACLLTGATMVLQSTFDVGAMLDVIEEERITVLPGPPTIFQSLLNDTRRAGRDLTSLRIAVTGAAMIPVVLIERIQAELGIETVLTAYGLSECTVVSMCRSGDDPTTVATTSGCAVPGVELRVVADGAALPPGEDGEILVRSENVMLGYLDDPAATAAAIGPDGWLRTGDVGHLDENGYLTITDRIKDMFTTGGFNVYPAEIEQVISRLDGVVDVAVIGIPDERLGEVCAAYVVTSQQHPLQADSVVSFCRQRLANFKVPRQVVFLESLPRNPGGKVLKTDLREMARREATAA
jgi:acyl-CoA synthetase (AMP-forming)/AMP-acid ligase II